MEMLHKYLMDRCNEIKAEGPNQEKMNEVIEVFHTIVNFAIAMHREGILFLAEMAETLDLNNRTEKFFCSQLKMVIEGTEPHYVIDMGINNLISAGFQSYEGLIALMYFRGSIMIQAGDTIGVVEMMLRSLLPESIEGKIGAEMP